MTVAACAHEGRPCSPVIGDCLCECPSCDLRRRTGLDPLFDGPEPGDVIPGTEYEPGGMYDPEPEPCPSACSVCAASGFPGCSPACEPCAAERAAYEAYLAETDHQCPREEFLDDPITVAYGVGAEMLHLVPCAVCDAREAAR